MSFISCFLKPILVISSSSRCMAPAGRTHSCLWHTETLSCMWSMCSLVKYVPLSLCIGSVLAERSAMHSGKVKQFWRLQSWKYILHPSMSPLKWAVSCSQARKTFPLCYTPCNSIKYTASFYMLYFSWTFTFLLFFLISLHLLIIFLCFPLYFSVLSSLPSCILFFLFTAFI